MAILRPFRAIRPSRGFEREIISKPYDVIEREEAFRVAEKSPYSFLHISRAEVDFPRDTNPVDIAVYEKAKSNIERFLDEKIFITESKAMIYIYKITMGEKSQVGVVGCTSIDEYINGVVKKHEDTLIEKEEDRKKHCDICDANTEPVILTYRDDNRIRILVESYMKNNSKEYIVEKDGVTHEIWAITDDNVMNGVCGLFKSVPAFYICEGHHRIAAAYKVAMERRKENPNYTGQENFNYFMSAVFPDTDLNVFAYNRVIKDLNGNSEKEFIEKIKLAGFEVENLGTIKYGASCKYSFGMYLGKNWYGLTAKADIKPLNKVEALDVSILQDYIIGPILGIKDIQRDGRIDFVEGTLGTEAIERRVKRDMKVGFCIRPIPLDDIMDTSDNGMRIPPKSTLFEPKLASGIFIHKL